MATPTIAAPRTTTTIDEPVKVWNDQTPERIAQDRAMDALNTFLPLPRDDWK